MQSHVMPVVLPYVPGAHGMQDSEEIPAIDLCCVVKVKRPQGSGMATNFSLDRNLFDSE